MSKDIQFLKGVGEKRAQMLAKKGIRTVEDMLYFFPRAHEDRTQFKKIEDTESGETVCLSITVFSPVRDNRIRRNMMISTMVVCDDILSVGILHQRTSASCCRSFWMKILQILCGTAERCGSMTC